MLLPFLIKYLQEVEFLEVIKIKTRNNIDMIMIRDMLSINEKPRFDKLLAKLPIAVLLLLFMGDRTKCHAVVIISSQDKK